MQPTIFGVFSVERPQNGGFCRIWRFDVVQCVDKRRNTDNIREQDKF